MPFYRFPHEFVYWDTVKNHEEIKNALMPIIKRREEHDKNNTSGLYNAYTSYGGGRDEEIHHPQLISELWRIVDKALDDIYYADKGSFKPNILGSFINHSWYTYYNKHGEFNYHNHTGVNLEAIDNNGPYFSSISVIYILNDENEENATSFAKFGMLPMTHQIDHHYDAKHAKEGTLLVFPSTLHHCVKRVDIPGRITIAFNIVSKYRLS